MCALEEMRRREQSTPRSVISASSSKSTSRSTTTPLPMTGVTPSERIPAGRRCSAYFFAVNNDGVSGVVASVELHDEVGVLAELVSGLAFAFVAPLGAEHDDGGHEYLR